MAGTLYTAGELMTVGELPSRSSGGSEKFDCNTSTHISHTTPIYLGLYEGTLWLEGMQQKPPSPSSTSVSW